MDITRAQQIDGWMSYQELEWLAIQASQRNLIVEVGCYQGRSTRAMADNTKGLVIAFDDFYGPRDGEIKLDIVEREKNYQKFICNMDGLSSKLLAVKISHDKIGNVFFFNNLQPDMVFIDGNHSYEAVKRDILFWRAKMISGGLLCGHDASHPPVAKAVSELLPSANLIPSTSIWSATI